MMSVTSDGCRYKRVVLALGAAIVVAMGILMAVTLSV
jgi:hypothetical protein